MTTNDDNACALDATTGEVLWRYAPDNFAIFRNFGIVANRGVAYCGGKLFLLTLDMNVVALDPATGQQLARVAIAKTSRARRRTTATRRRARRSARTTPSSWARPAPTTGSAAS